MLFGILKYTSLSCFVVFINKSKSEKKRQEVLGLATNTLPNVGLANIELSGPLCLFTMVITGKARISGFK